MKALARARFAVLHFIAALALFWPSPAAASLDETINTYVTPLAAKLSGVIFYPLPLGGHDVPFIVLWFVAIAIFSTVYFRFLNLRAFGLAWRLLTRKGQAAAKSREEGEITAWQALATSLSGTVGLGNIAGVAVAVTVGGPGATVWMIVMGLLSMSTKFLECTLGVKYRQVSADGVCSGGPMYYIRQGFSDRNMPGLGRTLAVLFAICCIGGAFGGGNMFQANQSYSMFMRVAGEGSFFADKGWLFGLILAGLTGAVIIGGIKSIARFSEKIFPAMTILYVGACILIIGLNAGMLPDALKTILVSAFSPEAAAGGFVGAVIAGVRRAAFSNESGTGSSAITYAAVKSNNHIEQGVVSMLNPFIDTVVICTMTALAIAVTGVYEAGAGVEGVTLTARAFATLGDWSIYVLALAVFLFAFSTLISWYYLGEKAFCYLAGSGRAQKMGFKLVYCFVIVIGAAANLTAIVDLCDALFFSMAIPNIIALYVMAPEIRRDLQAYFANRKAENGATA